MKPATPKTDPPPRTPPPTAVFRRSHRVLRARVMVAAIVVSLTAHVAWAGEIKPLELPKAVSREGAEYLQQLRKSTPFGTEVFDLEGLRAGMGSRGEPTLKDIKLIRTKVGDVPCEWVLAPGADPDLRLLYLHGGGWVSGSGGAYLALAAHISAAAKCAVLLPDYRLAPEHPFPAGLEDCVAAHGWIVSNGPSGPGPAKATFIAGDSAGGNLTLATLLALRDRKLPLPAGGIPISPATDFTLASESLKTVIDPIISAQTMPVFRYLYLGKSDPRNPLASPVFGDYRGIPPLLIQVGEHEMLLDDSIRVAEKARSDGISAKLEVWPGMVHVFQIRGLPESAQAIHHIADFMRSSLPPLKINPKVETTPTEEGLVAHWKFDEGRGVTTADASGGGNAGTLVNPTAWVAGPLKPDHALGFDGRGAHVDVGSGQSLDLPGEMSAFAWLRFENVTEGPWGQIVYGQAGPNGNGGQYELAVGRGKNVGEVTVLWKDVDVAASKSKLVTGKWYHIGFTRSGASGNWTCRVYIDGALSSETANIATDPGTAQPFAIGRPGQTPKMYFHGDIGELRLYNRALSDDDVAALYRTKSGADPQTKADEPEVENGRGGANSRK